MRKFRFVGGRIALFGILAITVSGLVVRFLWNGLMPGIFGLPAITVWQALGLILLSRILFGNGLFGGGRWMRRKTRFARGWQNLAPDERERFRQAMGHCGPNDRFPHEPTRQV